MLAVISPAKTLDYETTPPAVKLSEPLFPEAAAELVDTMRRYSPSDLQALMGISEKLAVQNAERFSHWQWPFPEGEARAALFAFKGDVYAGLDAYNLDRESIAYLEDHLRILSGLYGVLRPTDEMLPYRLEMGKKVTTGKGDDLYQFWGARLAEHVQQAAAGHRDSTVVNLASEEYFRSLKPHLKDVSVVTPVFKDWKNGRYKIISFFAKKARGMMVRYMAEHKIESVENLKRFDFGGYTYDESSSTADEWVFLRKQEA
ncbi:MAG: peroxide stress protein YaaA [Natronospirillum sp.]|uniref:peroxide stress protein YaaA n=1 Tax=Natronospirillum sp. TaxID=2812955 RepID=UPI0025FFB239|nr:peroxide stress protein YaaA [Natronospirillum sp.]MCH8550659.1 peroxide stress protein YaaA [Natronospirillum sp.]